MIGGISFIIPHLNPVCIIEFFDDMINPTGSLFSNTYGLLVPGIIPKQNIRLTKF